MGWLSEELGNDLSTIVSPPTLRRRAGRWCALVRIRGHNEEGHTIWTQRTHDTGIPCECDEADFDKAKRLAYEWHDEVLSKIIIDKAQKACDKHDAEQILGRTGTPRLLETFDVYSDHIFDVLKTSGAIKPSTANGYKSEAHTMIAPRLHGKRICDVTTDDVENVISDLLKSGYSTSTVRKCANVMGSVFRRAVEVDGLLRSPCLSVRAPSPAPPRQNSLTAEGWTAVLNQLSSMKQTSTVCAALLALLLGITREEACALTWREWDHGVETGTLRITSAIVKSDKGYIRDSPKTTARIRTIPLTESAIKVGEARRKESKKEWEQFGAKLKPGDYMLGRPDGWLSPDNLTKQWSTLCSSQGWVGELGVPLTFHDLRHTFATRLVATGADIKSASRILGHSTPTTTLRVYASEDQDAKRDAMDKIENSLTGSNTSNSETDDDEELLKAFAKALRKVAKS